MTNLSKQHLGRAVMVNWIDSSALPGWHPVDGAAVLRCVTVGILVFVAKDRVVIAGGLTEHGQAENQFTIPRCVIRRVKLLSGDVEIV